jgi:TPR repeat protein
MTRNNVYKLVNRGGQTKAFSNSAVRLVLACALALCSAAPGLADEDIATLMQRGELAYNRGDVQDAINWYLKAAEQGDARAQAQLGFIYDKAEADEEGVAWYRKSADQGHPDGLHGLARMYGSGEGVDKDMAMSMSLFEQAAAKNHLASVLVLAGTYETGGDGVSVDLAQAAKYWKQAGELGDQRAMMRLANAYRRGELGLPVDEQEAQRWQERLDVASSPDRR